LVIWKESEPKYWQRIFGTLSDALEFSENTLDLTNLRNSQMASSLERLWVDDRSGRFVLSWKTHHLAHLNQWTFDSAHDVRFFAQAFKNGGYTPSPFGHALILVPFN